MGVLTHDQLKAVRGGMSKVTAAFIRRWMQDAPETPFRIAADLQVSLKIQLFIADHDAQRATLAAKGSAGLKPCVFCANCVMRSAEEATSSGKFHTVQQHDLDAFIQYDPLDLEKTLCQWIDRLPTMKKNEKELREKCLGYNLTPDSIWSDPIARKQLRLNVICTDAMHCYFANGICGTEIALLLNLAKTHVGCTASSLSKDMQTLGWKRHNSRENAHWCKRLWSDSLFGSDIYKGEASATLALFVLLLSFTEQWESIPEMKAACDCFQELGVCVDWVRRAREGELAWQQLDIAQRRHHKSFAALWPDHVRPKHHHRLHLPQQWKRHGIAVTMWGVESSHRDFKSVFADSLKQFLYASSKASIYGETLLPRMLLRTVELINGNPFIENFFELQNPFSPEAVRQELGLSNVAVAAKCKLPMAEISEGDIVLWSEERNQCGLIHYFMEKASKLFAYVTVFEICGLAKHCGCRKFKNCNRKDMILWNSMCRVPSWSRVENDMIVCLA